MNAPVCPVVKPQAKPGTRAALLPNIPIATDVPSLIRAVNIIRDILRSITTSLTVNNVWEEQKGNTYILSPYPDWMQVGIETNNGYIYYKAKGKPPDVNQRAYIQRIDAVEFHNAERAEDPTFFWRLKKAPDSEYGDSKGTPPFQEDFFERIVNVHWGKKFYLYVMALGFNNRGSQGSNPVGSAPHPTIDCIVGKDGKARLLDMRQDPDFNRGKEAKPQGCLQYVHEQEGVIGFGPAGSNGLGPPIMGPIGWDEETSYGYLKAGLYMPGGSYTPAVDGTCEAGRTRVLWAINAPAFSTEEFPPIEFYYADVTTTPVDYYTEAYSKTEYLFEISAGDGVVIPTISGLLEETEDPSATTSEASNSSIYVSVYSTALEKYTRIKDLVDYPPPDLRPRLDPDHTRYVNSRDAAPVHKVQVDIHRDTNPAHAQISNYGKTFQPYKVIFQPSTDSVSVVPFQPPAQLPVPAGVS